MHNGALLSTQSVKKVLADTVFIHSTKKRRESKHFCIYTNAAVQIN